MILVFFLDLAFLAACVYLPLARFSEMFGGARGMWLRMPVRLRLRLLDMWRSFTNYV